MAMAGLRQFHCGATLRRCHLVNGSFVVCQPLSREWSIIDMDEHDNTHTCSGMIKSNTEANKQYQHYMNIVATIKASSVREIFEILGHFFPGGEDD